MVPINLPDTDKNNIHELTPGTHTIQVHDERHAKMRIDLFLRTQFPDYSRSIYQRLIQEGMVLINGVIAKSSSLVRLGDCIQITIVPAAECTPNQAVLDSLSIQVVYEHPEFLVINKPAGLVVHKPSTASTITTLTDWLVAKFGDIATVGAVDRPGIVHRLDKDTSGLLLIARTAHAHMLLSDLFKQRLMHKSYLALVSGTPAPQGLIDYNIARHPTKIVQMTHSFTLGKAATTRYEVREQCAQAALVEAFPVTGRTHQIRVHFAALNHPLLGDILYGRTSPFIARQALHAYTLSFNFMGTEYAFKQEPPLDFTQAVELVRNNN